MVETQIAHGMDYLILNGGFSFGCSHYSFSCVSQVYIFFRCECVIF
jgi:hypothetical protein